MTLDPEVIELDRNAQIDLWTREQQPLLIHLASELIAIPSENSPPLGGEKPVQHYLQQQLEELDFGCELYNLSSVEGLTEHPAYWPGRDYSDRPNLHAYKMGSGGGKSLLFSMHADVVIGSHGGQYAPFTPVVDGNHLYGRGSNDMKGGMAAVLFAFHYLKEHGVKLQGDLFFESVVDEEMGGANGTLAARLRGVQADAAIIPEPTNMMVCPSHLGGVTWRISVHGKGGMGFGGEQLANPIYGLARIINEIERYHSELGEAPSSTPGPIPGTKPNVVLSYVKAGDFEPGEADGIPEACFLELWLECYPGQSLEDMEQSFCNRIHELCQLPAMKPYTIEWEQITRCIPGTMAHTELTPLLTKLVSQSTDTAEGSKNVKPEMAPFACDAFIFNTYSQTPAVILGPTGQNAHSSDEYVEIESLRKLANVYIQAMLEWCGA